MRWSTDHSNAEDRADVKPPTIFTDDNHEVKSQQFVREVEVSSSCSSSSRNNYPGHHIDDIADLERDLQSVDERDSEGEDAEANEFFNGNKKNAYKIKEKTESPSP